MTRDECVVLVAGIVAPTAFKEALEQIAFHTWRNPDRWLKVDRLSGRDVQAALDKARDIVNVLDLMGALK